MSLISLQGEAGINGVAEEGKELFSHGMYLVNNRSLYLIIA